MTDHENSSRESWYAADNVTPEEVAAWYGGKVPETVQSAVQEGYRSPYSPITPPNHTAAPDPKKRRRTRNIWLTVCAVLLVAAIGSTISSIVSAASR